MTKAEASQRETAAFNALYKEGGLGFSLTLLGAQLSVVAIRAAVWLTIALGTVSQLELSWWLVLPLWLLTGQTLGRAWERLRRNARVEAADSALAKLREAQ